MRRAIGFGRSRRATPVEQMRLMLPDLRTVDPGFLFELRDGRLALQSGTVVIDANGAFDTTAMSEAVRRELFSFGWLRHIGAARSVEAGDHARRLLLSWSRSSARHGMLANDAAVAARRLLSLLAHVDAALTGANAADFDRIMDMLAAEAQLLSDAAPRLPMALPRLTALIALTAYHVCGGINDTEARHALERRLATELDRQVLPDGGHISRTPAALLELALDLIPLQRSYVAADLPRPAAMVAALERLGGMLAMLSHDDRQLGRFNGTGATALSEVAMVMKTLPSAQTRVGTRHAEDSGYIRLVNADALVLFDAGPGDETLAGETPFAGPLAFEFSAGRAPIIVNMGSDHGPQGVPRLDARATANHSTLILAGASSAPPTGARGGSTRAALHQDEGDTLPLTIRASLDGYRQRFGYVHHRTLSLLRDGWLLTGTDRLEAVAETTTPTPFDIRFHLHPTVHVSSDAAQSALRLTLADGSRWIMTIKGATAQLESSTFYAGLSGAKPSLQIVLSGKAAGSTEVNWSFERMSPAAVS